MSLSTGSSLITGAANAATILFGIVMLLQLLLAAGILPVTMAWGGRQQELTPALRFASVAAVVILGLLAYGIRRRAGLIGDPPIPTYIKVLAWVTTAYMAFNSLGNVTSKSREEKLVFGPITILLTLSCLLVSLSRVES